MLARSALPDLGHVYWIGGSPCAGKSTIADSLAATNSLTVYRCDDAYARHQTLVTPAAQPVFARLAQATCDEIWLRPVAQQVAEELALYREEFALIRGDLAALPTTRPVLAEGAALLPESLAALGVSPRRAIWIVPTPAFQVTHYSQRAWRHDILAPCTDPALAWHNWMARDAAFARAVAAAARAQGGRVLTVDGSRSITANLAAVADWFGLSGTTPPA